MATHQQDFYQHHYVATVAIKDNKITVLGGMAEKQRLREAKRCTTQCFVRELPSRAEIRLVLEKGHWVVAARRDTK